MTEVTIIGVDLAKRVFQVHGAAADGSVVFRKKLSRAQFLRFLARQPACTVAMEACATSHYWGREIEKLGHTVRLVPPIYVKPFVKRQKNDAADTLTDCPIFRDHLREALLYRAFQLWASYSLADISLRRR